MRNAYKNLPGNLKGRGNAGDLDVVGRIILKGKFIKMTQGTAQWRVYVNAVMQLRVP